MPIHDKIPYPIQEIADRISKGETQQQIADYLAKTLDPRVTAKLIYKVCKKHGIKCQRTGPRSGPGHPEWRGGRILDRHGYVLVYQPDHHECVAANNRRAERSAGRYYRRDNYIQEHRLVMERHLGRNLTRQEVVHHKNGDKQDNRIENLEVFESNGAHLAKTLLGRCPKWTRLGLANIRVSAILKAYPVLAQRLDYRQLATLLLAIQQELKLDAPPSKVEFDHYRTSLGKSFDDLCEMAVKR